MGDVSLRMLFLTPRPFYPADTGGRIRTARILERIGREHDITLVCFRSQEDLGEQFAQMRACCSKLETVAWSETRKSGPAFYVELAYAFASSLPYSVLKYRSTAMKARLDMLSSSGGYDLFVCDFLQPSINCLGLQSAPKILFAHNVEAMIRQRQIAHASNLFAQTYLARDAEKLGRYERHAVHLFDRCITVSAVDSAVMAREYGAFHTTAIPIAVDTNYFAASEQEPVEPEIVYLGSMDMLANQDAVAFCVREILPRIRAEVPVTLTIVGRNPPDWIRSLEKLPGVQVTGTVADVRPYLARAQVAVVPLRVGGGTRIKIFEAMSMSRPVVSTTLGAEGLPVTDDHDIRLADSPGPFAAAVVGLLRDRPERRRLGEAARATAERFTWDAAATAFSRICCQTVHG